MINLHEHPRNLEKLNLPDFNTNPLRIINDIRDNEDVVLSSVEDLSTTSNKDGDRITSNPSNSQINVQNSNDVVIGSLTQFNGPVTIVQNNIPKFDDREENAKKNGVVNGKSYYCNGGSVSSSTDILTPSNTDKSSFNNYWTKWPTKKCYLIVSSLVVIAVIVIVLTIISQNLFGDRPIIDESNNNVNESEINGNEDDDNHSYPTLPKYKQITRREWGGREPLNFTKPLPPPVDYAVIIHTGGVQCRTFKDCSIAMQSLQSQAVADGSPDIGYNFLVGGDGNIYIGRGWDIRNFITQNTIAISFIGNYLYDVLTEDMIGATKMLLEEGLTKGKLNKNYILIAHNQTFATLSPGVNVYKEIKKWKHFRSGDFLLP